MSYKYRPKEIRIKLTKMRLILLCTLIILGSVFIAFLPNIRSWYLSLQPIRKINYHGVPMEFREDLKLAKKISVIPNEESVKRIFWSDSIDRVTIAVLNTTNETSLIGVEAYEITFKLSTFYTLMNARTEIKGKEVSFVSEVRGNSTNPVIYIIPPVIANETLVKVENYTVYISGKTLKDLDLATIKFLMIVLGINIS